MELKLPVISLSGCYDAALSPAVKYKLVCCILPNIGLVEEKKGNSSCSHKVFIVRKIGVVFAK